MFLPPTCQLNTFHRNFLDRLCFKLFTTDRCQYMGGCLSFYDNRYLCQCNADCVTYGNCCEDYDSLCSGSGGGKYYLRFTCDVNDTTKKLKYVAYSFCFLPFLLWSLCNLFSKRRYSHIGAGLLSIEGWALLPKILMCFPENSIFYPKTSKYSAQ